MNSPEAIIGRLDAALARTGRTIMVRRWTGNGRENGDPRIEATVKASIRPAKGDQLIADINQAQQRVILSPSGLEALLPLEPGDKLVFGVTPYELPWENPRWWNGQASEKAIEGKPEPIYVGDRIVRIELTVLG